MATVFKSYQERKAEKSARKAAENEAYKSRKETEAKEAVQKVSRKPDEVKADLDVVAKELGKFYHQSQALEHVLQQETQRFHSLLIELDASNKAWPAEASDVVQEA